MRVRQVLEMWVGGEVHEFRRPVPRVWARSGAAAADIGTVTSPMPGRVIKACPHPHAARWTVASMDVQEARQLETRGCLST